MSEALNLLTNYTGDSDENDQDDEDEKEGDDSEDIKRLPLPSALLTNNELKDEVLDDPNQHDGRSRRYPHTRGNWNSLVYIPYEKNAPFDLLLDQMIELSSNFVELKKVAEPHVSLTRTFVLLYHYIDGFVSSLKGSLRTFPRFDLQFDGLKVYCNEDFSRTFLGLTVGFGKMEISKTVQLLDRSLAQYSLHPFYDEASFHMSILWSLGDARSQLSSLLPQLEMLVDASLSESLDLTIPITYYICKIGHKLFYLNLS